MRRASAASALTDAMASGKALKDGDWDRKSLKDLIRFLRGAIKRKLKVHQLKAALHLLAVQNGANFSVPGSGKTTVVLVVFELLRSVGAVDALLVVGPPSCFWPWRSEYEQVLGKRPTYEILAGGDIEERHCKCCVTKETVRDLYMTTFQTLYHDWRQIQMMMGQQDVAFYLVVDEAHYMKQVDGAWANAVLRVAPHAARRCILTGTPFPQSYIDAFNLFDFLWPQHSPLPEHTKHEIKFLTDRQQYEAAAERLDTAIGPLFYRVRKRDLRLAPQNIHVIPVTMNRYERLLYDSILDRIKDVSMSDYFRNIDLLRRLRRGRMVRLRQCVSYVKLLKGAVYDYDEDLICKDASLEHVVKQYDTLEKPAKLAMLVELVENLRNQGEKVVIWANFIGTLTLVRRTLKSHGHGTHLIYGDVPTERQTARHELTREKMISEFVDENSGINVLIANPAACAESISLHKACSNAIYYDLSYNCAQYVQSMDRIHRVGGSEHTPAHYHVLQYVDTIDSDIFSNVCAKASKMMAIIDRDYSIYSLDMFAEDEELEAYERLFAE